MPAFENQHGAARLKEPILVFDIETIPDAEAGRRILGLEGLDDAAVLAAMSAQRQQLRGNDFQPAHLHRIVAISIALRVSQTVENATIVFVVCDRGDRYLSTGVFPA